MASDVEIKRALAAISAALDEHRLDDWDPRRVQRIVTEAVGDQPRLTVDDGGGLHDSTGSRVGAIRRIPSGEWITERHNDEADRSDSAIPVPPP